MPKLLILITFLFVKQGLQAQVTFPVNGVRDPQGQLVLIRNAQLVTDTGMAAFAGEILIRNGKIAEIGKTVNHPADAVQVDFKGQYIYPSFIEPLCQYGMPESKKQSSGNPMVSSKEGPYSWNEALRTEQKAVAVFQYKEEDANRFREAGYGLVQTHIPDGISRGSAAVVSLNQANEHELILKTESAHVLSFQKGSSTQEYPGSLMGSIALLRQAYLDGQQYHTAIRPHEVNLSIEAWSSLQFLPQVFVANSPLDILRVAAIGREFNAGYIVRGSGKEYQRANEIHKTGYRLIIPLKFPSVYEVEDPYDALQIDLSDLKHWEMAPSNAAILAAKGISFVFTSQELKERKDLLSQVRKAIARGLSESKALYALTQGPAEFLGIQDQAGRLKTGMWANFIVTDGPLFKEKTSIRENWIQGKRHGFAKPLVDPEHNGMYELLLDTQVYQLKLSIGKDRTELNFEPADSSKITIKARLADRYLSGKIDRDIASGQLLFSAYQIERGWKGRLQKEDGHWTDFEIRRTGDLPAKPEKSDSIKTIERKDLGPVCYPFGSYGWTERPQAKNYLIRNTTVWTNEKEGKLEHHDVLIQNGKIAAVGKNIKGGAAIVIDGTNKHLTAGIIDEHSHIAINGGVNECTQASTAEVRIGDVINSEDINIYRQLAGGVTTAQLLHGSCNPIGGQSGLIKLRWGFAPEEMKLSPADGFIKFALGENVKRSGGNQGGRYPDTRMGVEQVYLDAFSRAKDYAARRKADPTGTRRDLDLEALAEILEKKRFITCHSYVQSEINMLMKVAEQFDFVINTFTHILEGYKIADLMKKHGAGAAGFSDWWAYKFEVYEAIPYNGAILHGQGVVTAFNSDDAEMARRLNQEAAKAVMYGNVPEEEALKFVTLNPAKLLHIDDRVGSIRKGKDADVVLWNDHPLSIKASPDMTFVDGIKFFDKSDDLKLRESIQSERNRIIQKMIQAKSAGAGTEKYSSRPKRHYHCDSVGGEAEEEAED